MLRKFVLAFAILALAAAFAGTVPAHGPGCWITLLGPSAVQGTPLAAGDYHVTVNGDKATFVRGKLSFTVDVKVESEVKKFDSTAIRFTDIAGKSNITEIRIGGSKTKLLFQLNEGGTR
ncbi:MAG TPA: hypothetical protein VME43_31295 [Bryobacteraceae bacterium]|nr:hypothetical protein [Bryobacteraceae bacterium]